MPETAPLEACGFCSKMLTLNGLERHPSPPFGEPSAEPGKDTSGTTPTASGSRYGSSRAPPLV